MEGTDKGAQPELENMRVDQSRATHLKLPAHNKRQTCLLLSDALASEYIQVVHFQQCSTQMTI